MKVGPGHEAPVRSTGPDRFDRSIHRINLFIAAEESIGEDALASADLAFMVAPLLAARDAGLWVAFAVPCLVLLALDVVLYLRARREPTIRESLAWVAIWTA